MFLDPFSAVDGRTGDHMFHNGILHGLDSKLVIIALNSHLHLIQYFHKVIIMKNGEVIAFDSPNNLKNSAVFAEIYRKCTDQDRLHNDSHLVATTDSTLSSLAQKNTSTAINPKSVSNEKGSLIKAEAKTEGSITASVYFKYFESQFWSDSSGELLYKREIFFAAIFSFVLVGIFAIAQMIRILVDVELLFWSNHSSSLKKYTVYISILITLCALILARTFSLNGSSVRSCRNIHNSVLKYVLNSSVPLFFDTHTGIYTCT
jgi:hypothetical protein